MRKERIEHQPAPGVLHPAGKPDPCEKIWGVHNPVTDAPVQEFLRAEPTLLFPKAIHEPSEEGYPFTVNDGQAAQALARGGGDPGAEADSGGFGIDAEVDVLGHESADGAGALSGGNPGITARMGWLDFVPEQLLKLQGHLSLFQRGNKTVFRKHPAGFL
jgi:hypothetical protein